MSPLLAYIVASLRYPALSRFASGGLGIEARSKRCANFWAPHLGLSQRFIEEGALLGTESRERLIVFGAGRLLDIRLASIAAHFSEVLLIDGDATAISTWRRAKRRYPNVSWVVTEITELLAPWSREVRRHLARSSFTPRAVDALITLLRDLATRESEYRNPRVMVGRNDTVISLNLLSQLPLFWRDTVLSLLEEYWGLTTSPDGALEEASLEAALERCSEALLRLHLHQIGQGSRTIVLTDIYFHYYHHDSTPWRTVPALPIPELPSCAEAHQFAELLCPPEHKVQRTSRWLWHLAPQGIEHPNHGEIHEVLALVSSRSGV